MENIEECPKCGRTPDMDGYFIIYECKKCGVQFCEDCGTKAACPECKSDKIEEAGECRQRR
jgi:predicted Zn-ribbon and HTH transcriptional regulator